MQEMKRKGQSELFCVLMMVPSVQWSQLHVVLILGEGVVLIAQHCALHVCK